MLKLAMNALKLLVKLAVLLKHLKTSKKAHIDSNQSLEQQDHANLARKILLESCKTPKKVTKVQMIYNIWLQS